MREITLTRGKIALVDDEDFKKVSQFKWQAQFSGKVWYAKRGIWKRNNKNNSTAFLHQFITGAQSTDHKDGDGLNCQRDNLRSATKQQNAWAKQVKRRRASSIYRGVSWSAPRSKWVASIKVSGRTLGLGRFASETQAAKAYDKAAREHYGEFASPNFLERKIVLPE